MSRPFKPTRLYVKQHALTGKLYFGKHVGAHVERYKGSGTRWMEHLEEHGREHVVHVWASDWFTDKAELKAFALAFSEIFDIVRSEDWLNRIAESGSNGGGLPTLKDKVIAKDANGTLYRVHVNDPRYLSGELVYHNAGKATFRDKDGRTVMVPIDDPRVLSGELIGIARGMVSVKDQDGNNFKVPKDDPRYLSGELISHIKGTAAVRDSNGNVFRVSKDDPRYLSGELVHMNKNRVYSSRICPHCGKVGAGPIMNRHHFDNCPKNLAKLVNTN